MTRKTKCPIVGEECWEHDCDFYCYSTGKNPETNVKFQEFSCIIIKDAMLTMENTMTMRQTGAEVGKLTNELIKLKEEVLQLAAKNAKGRIPKL